MEFVAGTILKHRALLPSPSGGRGTTGVVDEDVKRINNLYPTSFRNILKTKISEPFGSEINLYSAQRIIIRRRRLSFCVADFHSSAARLSLLHRFFNCIFQRLIVHRAVKSRADDSFRVEHDRHRPRVTASEGVEIGVGLVALTE